MVSLDIAVGIRVIVSDVGTMTLSMRISVMKALALIFLVFLAAEWNSIAAAQPKTYSETRSLLLKMDYTHLDKKFKKLFEKAVPRRADLIHALYDDDQRVCLNAQVVMKFLADPEMLAAINEWFEYRKKLGKDYWYPNVQLATDIRSLVDDRNLAKLVLKNLYHGQKDVSAKVVAYNKELSTAIIEVVFGETFTEGRHVAIRKENGKWRLLSDNLAWQS